MSNELHDIVAKFQAWYPDCPPLGDLIRDHFLSRWCRIDCLPGGEKSVPETDQEIRIALARHNAMATDALGIGGRCALIFAVHRDPAHWSDSDWMAKFGATVVEGWMERWSDHPEYGPDEVKRMKIAAVPCVWQPDRFRELILEIVTGEEDPVAIFVNLDTGRGYWPWDGGADAFVEDMPTAHALWDKYLAMGWTPSELYTGKRPNRKFPRGFPYEWRTLPWDDELNP